MLVLSRKTDQAIVIDGGITVRILQVRNGSVRVGIEAPDTTHIRREELDPREDWAKQRDLKRKQGDV